MAHHGAGAAARAPHIAHHGELFKKSRTRTWNWKTRYYELRGTELLCYRKQGDATPKSRVGIAAVYDVPDRGGGSQSHRFDVLCTGDDSRMLCFAAASDDDKRAWLTCCATASRVLEDTEHPRAAEFRIASGHTRESAAQISVMS